MFTACKNKISGLLTQLDHHIFHSTQILNCDVTPLANKNTVQCLKGFDDGTFNHI